MLSIVTGLSLNQSYGKFGKSLGKRKYNVLGGYGLKIEILEATNNGIHNLQNSWRYRMPIIGINPLT